MVLSRKAVVSHQVVGLICCMYIRGWQKWYKRLLLWFLRRWGETCYVYSCLLLLRNTMEDLWEWCAHHWPWAINAITLMVGHYHRSKQQWNPPGNGRAVLQISSWMPGALCLWIWVHDWLSAFGCRSKCLPLLIGFGSFCSNDEALLSEWNLSRNSCFYAVF